MEYTSKEIIALFTKGKPSVFQSEKTELFLGHDMYIKSGQLNLSPNGPELKHSVSLHSPTGTF